MMSDDVESGEKKMSDNRPSRRGAPKIGVPYRPHTWLISNELRELLHMRTRELGYNQPRLYLEDVIEADLQHKWIENGPKMPRFFDRKRGNSILFHTSLSTACYVKMQARALDLRMAQGEYLSRIIYHEATGQIFQKIAASAP